MASRSHGLLPSLHVFPDDKGKVVHLEGEGLSLLLHAPLGNERHHATHLLVVLEQGGVVIEEEHHLVGQERGRAGMHG